MAEVTATVEVDVPVNVAYNQWTQFEDFPHFMEGVEEVTQLDDATLHWRAEIAGIEREWDARIMEQEPDRVVSWQSTSGARNAGRVVFQPLESGRTRIALTMDHEPEGAVENIGQALGIIERRAEGDLERFKEFIEERGIETGAWRGEIHGGQVEDQTQQITDPTGFLHSIPDMAEWTFEQHRKLVETALDGKAEEAGQYMADMLLRTSELVKAAYEARLQSARQEHGSGQGASAGHHLSATL